MNEVLKFKLKQKVLIKQSQEHLHENDAESSSDYSDKVPSWESEEEARKSSDTI